jgi:hypothetical protein
LIKTAADGKTKEVPPNGTWEGDDYFMEHVKRGEAVCVKELVSPMAEDQKMNEEKLILDQPEKVTTKGPVEHVIVEPTQPLNENPSDPTAKPKDKLLNEDPMAGVTIITD